MRMGRVAAALAALSLLVVGCSSGSGESGSSGSASASAGGSGSASASPSAAASTSPSAAATSPAAAAPTSAPAPAATTPTAYSLTGTVLIDGQPAGGGVAGLRMAGIDGSAPTEVVAAKVGDDGRFSLAADVSPSAILYVTVNGGISHWGPAINNQVLLATLLGTQRPASIVVNELTTVASAFAASEYFVGDDLVGDTAGLAADAQTAATMADPTTGQVGNQFDGDAYRLAMFNSLGNALGACIADPPRCGAITRPAGREAANSTWSGFAATARDPEYGQPGMFAIQQGWDTFTPQLQSQPANGWYLLPS